jgi:hypothetical protein
MFKCILYKRAGTRDNFNPMDSIIRLFSIRMDLPFPPYPGLEVVVGDVVERSRRSSGNLRESF